MNIFLPKEFGLHLKTILFFIFIGMISCSARSSQICENENAAETINTLDNSDPSLSSETDILFEMLFLPGEVMSREHCYDRIESMIKHPANPVLTADRPWEGNGVYWPSVLYSKQDRLFRIWYMVALPKKHKTSSGQMIDNVTIIPRTGICYAESKDGIHWEKPALNKIMQDIYPNNNIVLMDSGFLGGTTTVIEDPFEADPNRRYKLLTYDHDGKRDGARTAVSPNGLDWIFAESFPVLPSQDTPTLWHDQRRGQYQAFLKCRIDNRRARLISVSNDFIHWTPPSLLLAPDLADTATVNFYGQTAFYHRGHDLGFLSRFELASQRTDLELITASEGIHWRRLPGRLAILHPGDHPGDWDYGGIYPGLNGPIIRDNVGWFYYYGATSRHDEGSAMTDAIGIATFTSGRLAGQQFEGEGFFGSLPFLCPGGVLELDADARKPMTVAVCGTGYGDGSALLGYENNKCESIVGNNSRHRVKWKNRDSLDDLKGKFISLRILGVDSVAYGITLHKNTPTN